MTRRVQKRLEATLLAAKTAPTALRPLGFLEAAAVVIAASVIAAAAIVVAAGVSRWPEVASWARLARTVFGDI